MATVSLRRWLQMSLILGLLVPLMLWHRACLALDHVLFPRFTRVSPRRPLFVVGVPRSGTTLVHRLLAADPQFTTMPLWELVLAPALVQKYFFGGCARVDRWFGRPLVRGLRWLEGRFLGGLGSIHHTSLWTPEEDYLGLAIIAACFILIHPFPFPELWDLTEIDRATTDRERTRLMQFYRGLVQRHLYFRGSHRIYLSKNPTFTGALNTLQQTFPDCRILACVREPLATAGSLVNSMTWGARGFGNQATHASLRDPLLRMLRHYYEILVHLQRQRPPHVRVMRFDDLLAQPGDQLSAALTQLDYLDSAKDSVAWQAALRECAAYRSTHRYDLRDYQLDPAELAEDFRFALEAFNKRCQEPY